MAIHGGGRAGQKVAGDTHCFAVQSHDPQLVACALASGRPLEFRSSGVGGDEDSLHLPLVCQGRILKLSHSAAPRASSSNVCSPF